MLQVPAHQAFAKPLTKGSIPRIVNEEVVAYWNHSLLNVAMPETIKNMVSPLSAHEVRNLIDELQSISYNKERKVGDILCRSASIICSSLDEVKVQEALRTSLATWCQQRYLGFYLGPAKSASQHPSQLPQHPSSSHNIGKDHVTEQIRLLWFYENNLTSLAGDDNNMMMVPAKTFLPSSLQSTFLPQALSLKLGAITKSRLPYFREMFNIPSTSTMAQTMAETAEVCGGYTELAPGEIVACITSLEALVDFAKSILMQPSRGNGQIQVLTSMSLDIKRDHSIKNEYFRVVTIRLKSNATSKYVSCHSLVFPFQAQFCHYFPNTRVYEVVLQSTTRRDVLITNIAICHLDTSKWSPDHVSFRVLGSKPGEYSLCHWSASSNFAFTYA